MKAVCEYCGKEFEMTRDRPNRFCSRHCSGKYYANRTDNLSRGRQKSDATVMKEMARELRSQIKALKKRKEELDYIQAHIKECGVCGKMFIAKTTKYKFCSKECFKKHDNARRDKRIYRNGTPDLSISLTKLYMRDGGVCALCGRHIDFDCEYTSADYPSIDHIVPIAKGGRHEWNNVQLACRGCNNAKSDKL